MSIDWSKFTNEDLLSQAQSAGINSSSQEPKGGMTTKQKINRAGDPRLSAGAGSGKMQNSQFKGGMSFPSETDPAMKRQMEAYNAGNQPVQSGQMNAQTAKQADNQASQFTATGNLAQGQGGLFGTGLTPPGQAVKDPGQNAPVLQGNHPYGIKNGEGGIDTAKMGFNPNMPVSQQAIQGQKDQDYWKQKMDYLSSNNPNSPNNRKQFTYNDNPPGGW